VKEASEVLLIAGPAGAGKTTVAEQWASSRPYRCAHVSLDDVRLLVKSGFADPQDGWGPEPQRQLDLARGSAALLARRFREAGIGCVIDDAVFPSGLPGLV
jgi:ABC-type cobalamin/Fe3+-siderophores transport system ATPase subunit